MKEHIQKDDSTPLLVFPEGTCVNNEYTVMFKKGAFDLDATVCPVAIKYNKIFVDAFWNSRRQPFTIYIVRPLLLFLPALHVRVLPTCHDCSGAARLLDPDPVLLHTRSTVVDRQGGRVRIEAHPSGCYLFPKPSLLQLS